MRVRVNQTRQQNLFAEVDDLARGAPGDDDKTADIGILSPAIATAPFSIGAPFIVTMGARE